MTELDSSTPPFLDVEQLEYLAELCRQQGAPVVDRLEPGLTDAEIDCATQPLGLRLPEEARVWWRWHNGARVAEEERAAVGKLGFRGLFHPLERAVERTLFHRELALSLDEYGEGMSREVWADRFLIITGDPGNVVCDCSVAPDAPTPISYIETHDRPDFAPPARSFGELITWWTGALLSGAWTWNGSYWECNPELLPADQRSTVLV